MAWRDGTWQGAPQDAVLDDDVHDLAVVPDAGAPPGERGATWMPRAMIRRLPEECQAMNDQQEFRVGHAYSDEAQYSMRWAPTTTRRR